MAGLKNLKKRRRVQIIILAFGALISAVMIFWIAAPGALQYYRTPTEVLAAPPGPDEVFKTGGLVLEGSKKTDADGTLSFVVTDTKSNIPVVYKGIPPDLFAEGAGTVVTGKMVDGVMIATEILAKHDETYMPKEVVDALKEQGVYVDPKADPGS